MITSIMLVMPGRAVEPVRYAERNRPKDVPAKLAAPVQPEVQSMLQQLPPGCVQSWNGEIPAILTAGSTLPIPRHAPPPRLPQSLIPEKVPGSPQPSAVPEPTPAPGLVTPPSLQPSVAPQPSPVVDPLLLGPPGADPLSGLGPTEPVKPKPQDDRPPAGYDPHAEAFMETQYPSAATCAKCHPQHYEEWRGSAHAYSAVSPMFHRFEQRLTELAQGTLGNFCVRCHVPVGVQMEMPRAASILDEPRAHREGITCVACHRVLEYAGKTNGERRIEPGNIHDPIVSAGDGSGTALAIANREPLKLKLDPSEPGPGQPMHRGVIQFETLSRAEFCSTCHQVAVHPGVVLEVVWAQYRASPAAAKGQTCQDCHMGQVPGKALGYECRPIAELAGKPWGTPKKHSNHAFWGPGVSLAHPGIFPHNPKADRWSARQWLQFDHRAPWGEESFERQIAQTPNAIPFPPEWKEADDRRDARKVIQANLERLGRKRDASIQTMEGAIAIEGPEWRSTPRLGADLTFQYEVRNLSEGHNLPTGSLGAQPQLWLNVVLVDPAGQRVWESGDLDANGDLRDYHSELVLTDQAPYDSQLFNLQTKFLFTNVKGTDREAYLPVNFDVDQIPFLRPGTLPITVLNHPPLIRMEAHSIPALGSKTARYRVPGKCIQMPGVYRLSVRMRSRMEPPYFMRFCRASPEMVRSLNEQILDLNAQSWTFEINH